MVYFILGICLVLAFIYLKVQTPIFSVQSSILIKDQQKGLGEEDDMMKELNIFSSNKVVDNEIEVIKSYTLMAEVVDSLKLNIGYYRQGFFRKVELYNNSPVNLQLLYANELTYKAPLKINIINRQTASINGQTVFFGKVTQTPYRVVKLTNTGKSATIKQLIINISTVKSVAEALSNDLKVEPSTKMSTVLIMTLENPIPEKGEDILNQLIDAYNAAGLADKNLSASNTLAFINARLKIISGELGDVEKQSGGL